MKFNFSQIYNLNECDLTPELVKEYQYFCDYVGDDDNIQYRHHFGDRIVSYIDLKTYKILAMFKFSSKLNDKVWITEGIRDFSKSENYGIKLFLSVRTSLQKNLQSGNQHTDQMNRFWLSLSDFGIFPKIHDSETYLIYSNQNNTFASLLLEIKNKNPRYTWILSAHDMYPSQNLIHEDSIFLTPLRNIWYSYDDE